MSYFELNIFRNGEFFFVANDIGIFFRNGIRFNSHNSRASNVSPMIGNAVSASQ